VFEKVRKLQASNVRHCIIDKKAMFDLANSLLQEESNAKLRAGADFKLFRWL
jgi:salicylate hydroxylase